MKYLKTIEGYTSDNVDVGDYVLVGGNVDLYHLRGIGDYASFMEYLKSNIGIVNVSYINDRVRVKYDNIPQKLLRFVGHVTSVGYCIELDLVNISHVSSNKEDLEAIIQSKKYNI